MITWIQKTFQQHFRIIFLVLLAVIIISFVFVTNASSGLGRRDYKAGKRPFFGLDLSNEQDASRLARDAGVSDILQTGGRRRDTALQNYGYARHAMLQKADELHVPAPTDAQLKEYIQALPIFMSAPSENEAPRFNAELYNLVRKEPSLYLRYSLTPADFARIISEDVRIMAASKLIAGPGYVLPSDIQQVLKQADTTWTLETATIDRESFKPAITTTDIELTQFFEANRPRYTIQPRVRASYVKVSASDFAYTAPIDDAELRSIYNANPALFPKPEGTPASIAAPATPDSDFNLVKGQVDAFARKQRANQAANKAASDLAYKLYAEKITPESASFGSVLAQNHASLPKDLADFSIGDIPAELGQNTPAIAKEVFYSNFGPENRVTNAVNTTDGAVILFWRETIPAREPVFAEVKDKVSADFIAQENLKRFTALGQTLKSQIEAALKTGSTFEQAVTKAASASGLTATTKTVPAFTLRDPEPARESLDMSIIAALETMKQGDVSDMAIVAQNGRLVYAKEQKLPDLTETNPHYASVAAELAMRNASITSNQYVQTLVESELAKSAPVNQ